MADNIDDVLLTSTWQSAYTLSGFTPGIALVITNKSSVAALSYIKATAPTSAASGYPLKSGDSLFLDAGESGLWLKGSGPICIQVG